MPVPIPKYCTLTDCNDAVVKVKEEHLFKADIHVDSALLARGIIPGQITLPQPYLTQLAANYALMLACTPQAVGNENTLLIKKAGNYQEIVDALLKGLNRRTVGLSFDTSGYGNFAINKEV
jgi:hypothetical protein